MIRQRLGFPRGDYRGTFVRNGFDVTVFVETRVAPGVFRADLDEHYSEGLTVWQI